jgi:hypothetical protein
VTIYNRTPWDLYVATAGWHRGGWDEVGFTQYDAGPTKAWSTGWWKLNRYGGSVTINGLGWYHVKGAGEKTALYSQPIPDGMQGNRTLAAYGLRIAMDRASSTCMRKTGFSGTEVFDGDGSGGNNLQAL